MEATSPRIYKMSPKAGRRRTALVELLGGVCLMVLFPVLGLAQARIDGTWRASVPTLSGDEATFEFHFATNGNLLSGTLTIDGGSPISIEDGKVRASGDIVTFKCKPEGLVRGHLVFIGTVREEESPFAFSWIDGPRASKSVQFTATRIR